MKGVTRAMASMNRQLNLPQIQRIMSEFERQSEIMDMKEEMMDDAIDDALGEAGEEEETEAVVQQVILLLQLFIYFQNTIFRSLTNLAFKWESNWEACRQLTVH